MLDIQMPGQRIGFLSTLRRQNKQELLAMQPIRFTPDVEQVDPDEERLTREIVEQMNATARALSGIGTPIAMPMPNHAILRAA